MNTDDIQGTEVKILNHSLWLYLGSSHVVAWDVIHEKPTVKSKFMLRTLCRLGACSILQ